MKISSTIVNVLSTFREVAAKYLPRPMLPRAVVGPPKVPQYGGALGASMRKKFNARQRAAELPVSLPHSAMLPASMQYRPLGTRTSGLNVRINPSFYSTLSHSQKLSVNIARRTGSANYLDDWLLQQAILKNWADMPRGLHRSLPPVSIAGAQVAPAYGPVFHNQFYAAKVANENGEPSGNMCGALALAHMTGKQPDWPGLHAKALGDLLKNIAPGLRSAEQREAAQKIIYAGVYVEHLHSMLEDKGLPHSWHTVLDVDNIDQILSNGKCKGVTYQYRSGSASHFAALRQDAAGQWWDMDSYNHAPKKIQSAAAFLKEKCNRELQALRSFEMICVEN